MRYVYESFFFKTHKPLTKNFCTFWGSTGYQIKALRVYFTMLMGVFSHSSTPVYYTGSAVTKTKKANLNTHTQIFEIFGPRESIGRQKIHKNTVFKKFYFKHFHLPWCITPEVIPKNASKIPKNYF